MERLRRIARRMMLPRLWVVLLCAVVSTVLLVYVFASGNEDSWFSCLVYTMSAYSLTIVCIRVAREAGSAKRKVRDAVDRVPFAHRCLEEPSFRLYVSLSFSLCFNVLYSAFKLVLGIHYRSVWFGTLAVYYVLLAVMRFLILSHAHRKGFGVDRVGELQRYRVCGVVLLAMNIVLSCEVVLVVSEGEGFRYAGYLIYVMAMYAFYNVVSAVVNVVRFQRSESPAMSAAKFVGLASALVSMLALETAMIEQFDAGGDAGFRIVMTACTGSFVLLAVFAMAVYMVVWATVRLRDGRRKGL